MPVLHQWDYLFAIGTMFAALDAFNIGANDVANSFATSVSSKSLTLRQACVAAAICEFGGAVLVGARVAGTIKNGIIAASAFQGNAGVQLLGFTCALVASATWLMIATRYSWPVSTTYSIISALIGVGIATAGFDSVQWGWNNSKGVATIFAGFGIAPAMAAGFGAIVYLITKFAVLVRKDPIKWGLMLSPFWFFTVAAVLTMSIVYKGAPSLKLNELSMGGTAAAIVGTSAVVALLSAIFWLPFVHAKVVKKDYTLRWYHFFYGPLLWKRPAPADADTIGNDRSDIPDYRLYGENVRHVDSGALFGAKPRNPEPVALATPAVTSPPHLDRTEVGDKDDSSSSDFEKGEPAARTGTQTSQLARDVENKLPPIEGSWATPRNLYLIARYHTLPFVKKVLFHGSSVDVHALQAGAEGARIAKIHERAQQYPNDVEYMYSFLQVLTACTASFAHGANDVSNAIGPYAALYHIWSTGTIAGRNSDIPIWILIFGASMIVIGLATYGYNIMKVLGNRLTLHSPSRGFSMELGAAITVILAANYAIPVSTTMCITGATLGVALCNGDWRAFNWRGLGWIVLGWVMTVPVVSVLAGCLMGILLNAPHF